MHPYHDNPFFFYYVWYTLGVQILTEVLLKTQLLNRIPIKY